jgi:hypothetical protein
MVTVIGIDCAVQEDVGADRIGWKNWPAAVLIYGEVAARRILSEEATS